MGDLLGYARVSTTAQDPQLQHDALIAAGCVRIFVDHASGTVNDRPQLTAVLDHLRAGDTLVVWKLDRLGRSMRHLVDVITDLSNRDVGFLSVTDSIDTATAGGRLVFGIFASIAEFERDLISERTKAGLDAARIRRTHHGRHRPRHRRRSNHPLPASRSGLMTAKRTRRPGPGRGRAECQHPNALPSQIMTTPDPNITTIGWIDASTVLGHEQQGFSTWLSRNLDLIAEALDLPPLQFVALEEQVEEFRADILALADDGSESGMPVIIENQYRKTDHDHLGKLITYLAGQQRGLGIWIAEHTRPAHAAAIDFLNRTSDESVGYALLRVRFAPGPDGTHYVDLQVIAQPNSWLKSTFTAADGLRGPAPERAELLQTVHDTAVDDLTAQGWRVRLPGSLKYIRLDFPDGHPLAATSYLTFRASPTSFRFRHVITGAQTLEASTAVVERLRDQYGDDFEDAVPEGTTVVWGAGAARKNAVNDQWQAEHPDGGWKTVTPDAAAQWAAAVAGSWMTLLTDTPPTDIFQADSPATRSPQPLPQAGVPVTDPSGTTTTVAPLQS